jgi:hypothetical protein
MSGIGGKMHESIDKFVCKQTQYHDQEIIIPPGYSFVMC